MARTHSKNRCDLCQMSCGLCICSEIPSILIQTQLRVIMHYREWKTSTNTARWLCLLFPKTEILFRGRPEETALQPFHQNRDLEKEGILLSKNRSVFLYPSPEAEVLTSDWCEKNPGPYDLIVPDGSWRQARKIYKRTPGLEGVAQVKLSHGPVSEYSLRSEPYEHTLSTFEAIARALEILEAPHRQPRPEMDSFFKKLVSRVLWSRGKLANDRVLGGLPISASRN